jgi:DNA-binding CsgD family transcriptional regulator
MAEGSGSPYLGALAGHGVGTVLLREGNAADALRVLRGSLLSWEGLGAPYEAARTRAIIADACAQLGDGDGAEFERQAARRTFESLGAASELGRLLGQGDQKQGSGLTSRELDVLRLVAQGKTNRMIGDELVISEKTVARHLSNIFTKLELPSRAAATAYAYEHSLI